MSYTDKDPNRVAGGLKAAVHNPNVSEEAKESARERLDQMGVEAESDAKPVERTSEERGANHGNVMGGYKATLKNPNVSEEAKENAQEILEQNNEI